MLPIIKRNTIQQILFWGGLWIVLPVLLAGNLENIDRYLVRSGFVLAGIVVTVWLNMEYLLPRLFFKKNQVGYIFAGLALILLVVVALDWDGAPWADYFNRPRSPRHNNQPRPPSAFSGFRYVSMAMPFFTALIGSALFEIAGFASRKEKEAANFRNEKLEAELKFLKSQINPHFLFNALNNIYTLTLIKSDQAPDNLLKLSGILRYMLYECKADQVPLNREIEYLRHYIDLHLLKDSRGLNVEFVVDESRPELSIAPMLLIPFVENAFKHSKVEDINQGWIRISLFTEDHQILFKVSNSLPATTFTKDKVGGIGLENVRRQLELLYTDRHELKVETDNDAFHVLLKLQLS